MSEIRVRFAPSPTGSLHVGGARTALFNWLFARQNGGTFVLRLDDTDLERNLAGTEEAILAGLRWLGLDWDEGPDRGGPYGPYRQSERTAIYQREARRLLDAGAAYPCYCTPAQLAQQREEAKQKGLGMRYDGRCRRLDEASRRQRERAGQKPALRLRLPEEGVTVVPDLIRGEVSFAHGVLDDFVILKSNGMPTYNFACVVDDSLMRISHVIRAEEHLSNTPKQIVLYRALGYPAPVFAHVPMILAPDRSKLSKRHGATSVEEFKAGGYLPASLVNYLALLGWSPGDDREIIPAGELRQLFSLGEVSRHAAVYDVKKLTWLNAQYLNLLPLDQIVAAALPFFQQRGFVPAAVDPATRVYVTRVVATVRSRVHTLVEMADAAAYFFSNAFTYDEKGVRKYFARPGVADLLARVREVLAQTVPFDPSTVEAACRQLGDALGIPGGALIHPTRLALSGRTVTPGLFEIMAVLGRDRCLARLDRAVHWINTCPFNQDEL